MAETLTRAGVDAVVHPGDHRRPLRHRQRAPSLGLDLYLVGFLAPALLGVSLADHLLGRTRPLLNRASQAFVLVRGLWYPWRGLVA